MYSGRKNKLTGQIGEFLVTAELGRRNYVAAPFAGNVPLFDIVAANELGKTIAIQVKTSNGGSWHSAADKFLKIRFSEGRQKVLGKIKLSNPDLVCIFVMLDKGRKDLFFIFKLRELQDIVFTEYSAFMKKVKGKRPKNPKSLHFAVVPKQIHHFLNNWGLVERLLKGGRGEVGSG